MAEQTVRLARTVDESRAGGLLLADPRAAWVPRSNVAEDLAERFYSGGWEALTEEEHIWVEQEFLAHFGGPMRDDEGNPDPNHQHAEPLPPG